MGFMTGLQLVLIALKLLDKVDWSWWAVMSPTLFNVSVFIGVIILAAINA